MFNADLSFITPNISKTERQFAISDIHGCYLTFKKLLKRVKFSKSDHLFVIGDFINKGKRTEELFRHLLKLNNNGQLTLLRGNHEQMLLDVWNGKNKRYLFHKMGGTQTLKSFKAKSIKHLPTSLIDLIQSAPINIVTEEYILVHGGLNFEKKNPFKQEIYQLNLRNWYHKINHELLGNRIILHGHSPIKRTVIEYQYQKMLDRKYLDLDSGCAYQDRKGMGYLTIFDMSNKLLYFQKNID